MAKSRARGAYSGGAYKKKRVKKFATTTEEIRRILRLVANFTGTGENKVHGGEL